MQYCTFKFVCISSSSDQFYKTSCFDQNLKLSCCKFLITLKIGLYLNEQLSNFRQVKLVNNAWLLCVICLYGCNRTDLVRT